VRGLPRKSQGFRLARPGARRILVFVPNDRGKFVALLLLLLMALDLSTASVCEAKGFPGGSIVAVSGNPPETTEGPQSAEDDGCFCCCVHIVVAGPCLLVEPEPHASTHAGLVIPEPSSFPQSLFHPPKA